MSTALISPRESKLEGQALNSQSGDDADPRGEIDLLIVDDRHAAQYSLWALLSWQRDIRVTGTANSSAEALTLADQRRPHVCLISAGLGQHEGLALASRMKHLIDPPRVLIFADALDQRLACAAIVAGADGVLCRYADPDEQAVVVRRAASGERQFPDLQPDELHSLLDHVEDGDRAIVAMLLEHTPLDDIAGVLGISARSLELRRRDILRRLRRAAEPTTVATPTAGVQQWNGMHDVLLRRVGLDGHRPARGIDKQSNCYQHPTEGSAR